MGKNSEDQRARIQAVALERFLAQGYDRTSLREMADELGFTKAALYYHYRAKGDLLAELVEPLLDRIDELLRGADPGHVEARRLLTDYLCILTEHCDAARLLARDQGASNHTRFRARIEGQNRRLRTLLVGSDGLSPVQEARASAALGAIWRPIIQLLDVELDVVQETVLDSALAALRANEGTPR